MSDDRDNDEDGVIRCELNKAVEEAEDEEGARENIAEELEKLAPLATENWRDAFRGGSDE